MDLLVKENPDITLAEIREAMHLSIQKSEISDILRNKLGLRYKKDGTCQRTRPCGCKSQARNLAYDAKLDGRGIVGIP